MSIGFTPNIHCGKIEDFVADHMELAHTTRDGLPLRFVFPIPSIERFAGDDDKYKHEKHGDARRKYISVYQEFCEATIRETAELYDMTIIDDILIETTNEHWVEFRVKWEFNETQSE